MEAKVASDEFHHDENRNVSKACIILNKPIFQVIFFKMTCKSEIWKTYIQIGLQE